MPNQNLRGVWSCVDVLVHFGFRSTALGTQKLEDDDEQDQETGGGPLKHGAGKADGKPTHPYRHKQKKNTVYRFSFPTRKHHGTVMLSESLGRTHSIISHIPAKANNAAGFCLVFFTLLSPG